MKISSSLPHTANGRCWDEGSLRGTTRLKAPERFHFGCRITAAGRRGLADRLGAGNRRWRVTVLSAGGTALFPAPCGRRSPMGPSGGLGISYHKSPGLSKATATGAGFSPPRGLWRMKRIVGMGRDPPPAAGWNRLPNSAPRLRPGCPAGDRQEGASSVFKFFPPPAHGMVPPCLRRESPALCRCAFASALRHGGKPLAGFDAHPDGSRLKPVSGRLHGNRHAPGSGQEAHRFECEHP